MYQSERFVEQDNFTELDDFWLFDLRAGLLGDQWDFLVYVDNLLDDDTYKAGSTGPDFSAAISDMGFSAGLVRTHYFGPLAPPRVIGVRFNMRFGG
jgi:outer membrane receptor protein involved in Fe transport